MTTAEILGARLDKHIIALVEKTAQEERVDKTSALKNLILLGRKQYLLKKYLEKYRIGQCSLDKAAFEVGITVSEMMQEAAKAGVPSSQTISEYRKGLELS